MTTRPPITFTRPTPNPELDAARHDDDLEAACDLQDEAARRAPGIVLLQLKAIKKPADWFDTNRFAIGYSAEAILQGAFDDSNDKVSDSYSEFMTNPTPEAREKLIEAMAEWFLSVYAYEVYTDWLEDQQ